jgi:hypothetical protein
VRAALIPTACGSTFINVPMPLLFALDAAVEHKNRSLLQSLSWTESAAAREEEASQGIGGFFDKVQGWWTGQPTHGDKAAAERSKAATIRTEQKAIQESLAAISRQTKQLQLVRRKTGTYEYVSRVAQMVDRPAHRRGFLNLG